MGNKYYDTPPQEMFEEMKRISIGIWMTYEFADEKIERISHMENIKDNMLTMFAMFDANNQKYVFSRLSAETKQFINDRTSYMPWLS